MAYAIHPKHGVNLRNQASKTFVHFDAFGKQSINVIDPLQLHQQARFQLFFKTGGFHVFGTEMLRNWNHSADHRV